MAELARTMFEVSRASEYFNARELEAQTGRPKNRFLDMALKELMDNALDACETARVAPVVSIEVEDHGEDVRLTIADNGPGIAPETIERMLHFDTRTSDKAVYRTPTRGAQGNALKTVIGLPHALGSSEPVIIRAWGIEHTIRAWLDPIGEVRIEHDRIQALLRQGTEVVLTLPKGEQDFSPRHWVQALALFNPHASVKIRDSRGSSEHAHSDEGEPWELYQAIADDAWKKFMPGDCPSAHWYDCESLGKLICAYTADHRKGGEDLTLRGFIHLFRDLSSTVKTKAICNRFPEVKRLSDIEAQGELIPGLLKAMQDASREPKPSVLGLVGEAHLMRQLDDWGGVKRQWYAKAQDIVDGVPFGFEVFIAELETEGACYRALNFSPAFGDFLGGVRLKAGPIEADGIENFLRTAHVFDGEALAVAYHLTSPVLAFLDRGKTRVDIGEAQSTLIAEALWKASKELHKEGEARKRDAAKAERRRDEAHREWNRSSYCSQLDAVFAVIPEAMVKATGNGVFPVSARNLYYQVRPLIQQYTSKALDYTYFSQDLLTQYQKENGPLEGLYYDPKGVLYEPHTGKTVPIGTREIERYTFPEWRYNKILYIEKKGLWPILESAKIAERYDMAILAGEGYASVAARVLFQNASKGQYQLFVLHDADPDGYNIARTLCEETDRMQGYSVDVIDLGLRLQDGLDMGLEMEDFTRKRSLPSGLELNTVEREYFIGRCPYWHSRDEKPGPWSCKRIELNAMSAPSLVAYIEKRLDEEGASGKVVPPDEVLQEHFDHEAENRLDRCIDEAIADRLRLDDVKRSVRDALNPGMAKAKGDLSSIRAMVQDALDEEPVDQWEAPVDACADGLVRSLSEAVKTAVEERLPEVEV